MGFLRLPDCGAVRRSSAPARTRQYRPAVLNKLLALSSNRFPLPVCEAELAKPGVAEILGDVDR